MQSGDVVGKLYMEDLYPSGVAAKVMELYKVITDKALQIEKNSKM